ncbi:hypothetical protein [uncultured Shewanella sp.]|uniref:hypothetical protein n=1 Tax=uncultured Shewanella sp. TaxID=173975 RepID=UPI00260BED26|nr:hypothetical protein [uncultured Shewanella sp.]
MNKSVISIGISLCVMFLISAVIFILLRNIVGQEQVVSEVLLTDLSKGAMVLAVVVISAIIFYVLYQYWKKYQAYTRKLLIIGHEQPNPVKLAELYAKHHVGEKVDPMSIPSEFIGDVLPKTKLQLMKLRGSFFYPSSQIMLTFNARHLTSLTTEAIHQLIHDINSIIGELTAWRKKTDVMLVVHNMQSMEGYDAFEAHALESTEYWYIDQGQSLLNAFNYYQAKALNRQTQIPATDFIKLLAFFNASDKNICPLDVVMTSFAQVGKQRGVLQFISGG